MTTHQLQILRELRGTKCVCGRSKPSMKSHCRDCFFALEKVTQRALYKRIGEGYEEAYAASVNALRMKGRVK